jgi:hypothetical protein
MIHFAASCAWKGKEVTTMRLNKMVRRLAAAVVILGTLAAVPQAAFAQMAPRVWRVQAYDSNVWRVWVNAGQVYSVVVDGDNDTDLDLFVSDVYGRVGQDIDYTDYCVVRFRARVTGYVEIRIDNLGHVYNEYVIQVR